MATVTFGCKDAIEEQEQSVIDGFFDGDGRALVPDELPFVATQRDILNAFRVLLCPVDAEVTLHLRSGRGFRYSVIAGSDAITVSETTPGA